MDKAVLLVLAFLLSGVPATAVVCDLLLCLPQAQTPPQGCHEHGDSPSGDAVSPATRDCTHLADSVPFVASTMSGSFADAAVALAAAAPRRPFIDEAIAAGTFARAAPSRSLTHVPLALRI